MRIAISMNMAVRWSPPSSSLRRAIPGREVTGVPLLNLHLMVRRQNDA
jgi:hypothetical protein